MRIRLVGQRPFLMMKIIKTIAISWLFEYTICNRVARSLFGIGDQAETCAQLFYVRSDFMDLKKPLTFDEQLDKLAAHGMIIRDREKAKDILNL